MRRQENKLSIRGASVTTHGDSAKGNTTDHAQGEPHTGPLRAGKSYVGVIVNGDNKSHVYTVRIGDRMVEGCHWVAGINAALLGINTHLVPTRGTRVSIIYGNPSFIYQGLPGDRRDDASGNKKTLTQSTGTKGRGKLDEPDHTDFKGTNTHATFSHDQFEGELVLENQMGTALALLHSMASLKSGERAKIEAFVVNDMVRIVSDCFKHISAFGDMQIYNDGRLNVKFDGTSYEFEAWSLLDEGEAKAMVNGNEVPPEPDITKTGRWRFSQYIGFLGDFVHQFVTEPSATASSIGADAKRPGKSRIQQMADGSVLIQSVADIALERVCRVQVPIELRRWDDPQGNLSSTFKQLNKRFLKIWDFGGSSGRTIHHTAYQLREYARWLSCFHSYARFHQLTLDWRVPTESETDHEWTNQEKDVESANGGGLLFYDTYACMRIMRDGAIVMLDGYGNSVTMAKSGIQLSAIEHIEIDAGGDIRLTAGSDIILKARRNIEISAICGGLILKACTWFKGLVEKGILWLKSDAADPLVDDDTDNPRGETGVDYPKVELRECAVLIESSKGRTALRSNRTLHLTAEGVPDNRRDQNDVTASVLVQSKFQDVRVYGQRNALFVSKGANSGILGLESSLAIVADAPKFLSTAYLFDVRATVGSPETAMTFQGGKLSVRQIASNYIAAINRLAGPKLLPTIDEDNPPPPGCCLAPHLNHVSETDGDFDTLDLATAEDLIPRTSYENIPPRNPLRFSPTVAKDFNWEYPAASDYKWAGEKPEDYPRFEPLAQQRARTDEDMEDRVDDWRWAQLDRLRPARRTNVKNLPYPGQRVRELHHPTGAGFDLHKILQGQYNAQDVKTDLKERPLERKYRKRDEE